MEAEESDTELKPRSDEASVNSGAVTNKMEKGRKRRWSQSVTTVTSLPHHLSTGQRKLSCKKGRRRKMAAGGNGQQRLLQCETYHLLWFSSSQGDSQGQDPHQCEPSPTPDTQSTSPGLPARSWWRLHRCRAHHAAPCPLQPGPGIWLCSAQWRRGG